MIDQYHPVLDIARVKAMRKAIANMSQAERLKDLRFIDRWLESPEAHQQKEETQLYVEYARIARKEYLKYVNPEPLTEQKDA